MITCLSRLLTESICGMVLGNATLMDRVECGVVKLGTEEKIWLKQLRHRWKNYLTPLHLRIRQNHL